MEGGEPLQVLVAVAANGTLQGYKFLRLGESISAANEKASARVAT